MTNLERFWAKVDRPNDAPNTCWVWTAAPTRGHGRFRAGGRDIVAHRYAYQRFVGPVPDKCYVHHTCGNALCVRPEHLQATPRREFNFDTAKLVRGEGSPNAVLCDEDVRNIRARAAQGATQADLARSFCVSQPTISLVIRRLGWAHVA